MCCLVLTGLSAEVMLKVMLKPSLILDEKVPERPLRVTDGGEVSLSSGDGPDVGTSGRESESQRAGESKIQRFRDPEKSLRVESEYQIIK